MRALLLALCAALLLARPAHAQSRSGLPVDIQVPLPPAPVVADGQTRLVYELRITNFAPVPFDLREIDVVADGTSIARFSDGDLEGLLETIGAASDNASPRTLGSGRTVVAYLDLTLPRGAKAPASISHRLAFTRKAADGTVVERSLTGIPLTTQPPAITIGAPLRGPGWVAANGLFSKDHRRSFNAVDGREYLAQRFAIDWVQLGPDGRFFRESSTANENFYGYGAEVIAVADGVISNLVTDQPENAGSNPPTSRTVTLDSITGNSLVLDLGGGRYALYAHLKPGSLKVALGDKVKAGQVLAQLGNSGNSDAPHLHFQLMNANSPLGAEGLPYQIRSFRLAGRLANLELLENGQAWTPAQGAAELRRNEFPADLAVVTFP